MTGEGGRSREGPLGTPRPGDVGDLGDLVDLVELGVVVGAHGLRGEVRVRYLGDGPENLLSARKVWLVRDTGTRDPAAPPEPRSVQASGAGRAGEVRLRLEGVRDRDAAAALRGCRVSVPADALAPLEEGEYYWHQLVGCRVEDSTGAVLGRVTELWETGAHDVLVVETDDGRRHLLPTAREVVREIDVEAGRIRVDVVPGLLDGDA